MTQSNSKYAYEYGKRWDRRVPRGNLRWLINKLHVSTSDEAIEADIRRRCQENPDFTAALILASVRYALAVHHSNQDLYHRVTSGRL